MGNSGRTGLGSDTWRLAGLKYYLNFSSTFPTNEFDGAAEEFKEMLAHGYVTAVVKSGQGYHYTAYPLTEAGEEAAKVYREEMAASLIKELSSELLCEVKEFGSPSGERHALHMDDDTFELLATLEEYEITEHHWEESWDDAWVYFELSDFGKIVWEQLMEKDK